MAIFAPSILFGSLMRLSIIITLRWEGFHFWPKAPVEMAFLRSPHRHEFHIRARLEVSHSDRDVEFIELKNNIRLYLEMRYPAGILGAMSCEALAIELIEHFGLLSCEVMEDGENGALVEAE